MVSALFNNNSTWRGQAKSDQNNRYNPLSSLLSYLVLVWTGLTPNLISAPFYSEHFHSLLVPPSHLGSDPPLSFLGWIEGVSVLTASAVLLCTWNSQFLA